MFVFFNVRLASIVICCELIELRTTQSLSDRIFSVLPFTIAQNSASVALGQPCSSSDQCIGNNGLVSTECYQGICGGSGGACRPDNGLAFGLAPVICESGESRCGYPLGQGSKR